jgi:hypothetical protein
MGRVRTRSVAAIVVALLPVAMLGGCATAPGGGAGDATEPYVGVFTGDYVDGKPLYRFPPIHVIGSRSSLAD